MGLHPAQMGTNVAVVQETTNRIRSRMQELSLSVAALAESAAIPRMTLSRRLADPATLTLAEVDRIAASLNVDPTWLLVGDAA